MNCWTGQSFRHRGDHCTNDHQAGRSGRDATVWRISVHRMQPDL